MACCELQNGSEVNLKSVRSQFEPFEQGERRIPSAVAITVAVDLRPFFGRFLRLLRVWPPRTHYISEETPGRETNADARMESDD